MFDIDHFKNVNDSYGHNTGNQVLADLALNSREALREVDLLGRYGGEEFVALLPESGTEGAMNAAERLRLRIAGALFKTGRVDLHLTVSLGVAVLGEQDTSLPHLIERADQALYIAKRNGRNRSCLWSDSEPIPLDEPIPLKSPKVESSNQ
jgi:diguanylate cyclase (GGDEF)-like protein